MASEVRAKIFLEVVKSNRTLRTPSLIEAINKFDQTGESIRLGTQSVGTSKENLEQPTDLGTLGWVFVWNRDTTNFVEVGDDADAPTLKLLAGEFFMGPWGATDISCKADTAACQVDYGMAER